MCREAVLDTVPAPRDSARDERVKATGKCPICKASHPPCISPRRRAARGAAGAHGLLGGCAQPAPAATGQPRVYRLGLLAGTTESGEIQERFEQFTERLAELGYVEDQNLLIALRGVRGPGAGAAADEGNRLVAAELVGLPVDVLVTGSPASIRVAMASTSSIPIVILGGAEDPVALGFVESFARPGGNVTGAIGASREVDLKRLQLLVEAAPAVSRVAVLGPPGDAAFWEPATRLLGIDLFSVPAEPGGADPTVARAVALGADGLLVRPGTGGGGGANAPLLGAVAARHRLPGISTSRRFVAAGGLMAYEARDSEIQRRAADYVDRILRGARPADLPVELPTRYDLIVNMGAARALGLSFSRDFFAQVDEVIE